MRTLRYLPFALSGLIAFIATRSADGHGIPIVVTASAGTLVATGNVSDSHGYAPQLVVQTEEGGPLGSFNLENVGPVVLWNRPAFSISGLNDSASLSIEVLERPVKDSSPAEERTVWYWKPTEPHVVASAADIYLLGTEMRFTTLPHDGAAPAPFLLTSSVAGQQHPDNHGLLSYALDNDDARPAGAYGFFAKLTSSLYAPSNPFLVVLNYQLDDEQMADAAMAINAAAVEADLLPGDFNQDGAVNAADFVVWRKGMPTEGDYATWQTNFGRTQPGSGNGSVFADFYAVPEPATYLLPSSLFVVLVACRRARVAAHHRGS
jgi:hypothetical protein